MLAPFTLALAIAAAPPQPVQVPDRPVANYLERTVFTVDGGDPAARLAPGVGGDRLTNGATVGAIIGGGLMFAGMAWLCHALREPDDPQCWGPVLLWTGVGAGAGALVGAGVDALVQRKVTVRWTVRF